jgi:ABC-type Mn2+/Zn2+ transport system permease subunit
MLDMKKNGSPAKSIVNRTIRISVLSVILAAITGIFGLWVALTLNPALGILILIGAPAIWGFGCFVNPSIYK